MNSNESSNTLSIPEAAWDNTDMGTQTVVIRIHAVGTEWTKDVAEGVMEVLDAQQLEDCEVRIAVLATDEEVTQARNEDGHPGHIEFDAHAEIKIRDGVRYMAAWVVVTEADAVDGNAR